MTYGWEMTTVLRLRSLDPVSPDIEVPDKGTIVIGRNPMTKIKNVRVSRRHVRLALVVGLNRDEGDGGQGYPPTLEWKHLGGNPASVCSRVLGRRLVAKGETVTLEVGDSLHLVGEGPRHFSLSSPACGHYKVEVAQHVGSIVDAMASGPSRQAWAEGLYAAMEDPEVVVFKNHLLCIIKDKYPKAKYHYLVIPMEKLRDLGSLDARHVSLIEAMVDEANKLIARAFPTEFRMGFHCVPSMAQVHMHLISQDFDSPSLKTKKHWNSFNTDYFIDPGVVIQMLRSSGGLPVIEWKAKSEGLLKLDLKCHKCDARPKTMPDLKSHLKSHLK